MVSRSELVCGVLATCSVVVPLVGWVVDLANGQVVDVSGPWWMFWLFFYTFVSGWVGSIISRLLKA
jgi:hypothetical protein